MFKLKKKDLLQKQEIIRCLSGEELLEQPNLKKLHSELKSLLSCPSDTYTQLYLVTLHRLAELSQAMPFSEKFLNEPYGLLTRQLRLTIIALKLRQGLLLPKNAPIETISAEEARWTYAIFSACMLKELYLIQNDRDILLHHKNGEIAGKWIPLAASMYEKNLYYSLTFVVRSDVTIPSQFMATMVGRIIPPSAIRWVAENKELFSIWWSEILNQAQSGNELTSLIEKAGIQKSNILLIKNNEFLQLSEKFISWLNASVQSYPEKIFQTRSGFFVSENSLDDFLATISFNKNLFIQAMIKNNGFILNSDTPMHVLSSKRFEDQHHLRGIILNREILPEHLIKIPLNTCFIENVSI